MKLSEHLRKEREFVERTLADQAICLRCQATLKTFADKCEAHLDDACPGFLAIERARQEFQINVYLTKPANRSNLD